MTRETETEVQTKSNTYDLIIIGGGMAGLYAAYKLLGEFKNISLLLLEKEDHIGGRAGTEIFHGVPILIGAGVGRKEKDYLLIKLIQELQIPNHEFPASTHYSHVLQAPSTLIKQQFAHLRSIYKDLAIQKQFKHKTFGEFACFFLGKEEYALFSQCAGYTDYVDADIHDVLYNYGFDDNTTSWTGISLHWSDMTDSLTKKIGKKHILTNHEVSKIHIMDTKDQSVAHRFEVVSQRRVYQCNHIIMATTIDGVKQLLPIKSNIYDQIHGQTFLRVYGHFTKESSQIMTQYVPKQTVVQGPIHKIIPMNPEKGVYMIVYTDNDGAKTMNRYTKNTAKNREKMCRYLEQALGIPEKTLLLTDMRDFYWKIGTHYFEPMKGPYFSRSDFICKAQRPYPGIFIVGEMISQNQGWVEGALESVEQILG
jgi:hypothetical protein